MPATETVVAAGAVEAVPVAESVVAASTVLVVQRQKKCRKFEK